MSSKHHQQIIYNQQVYSDPSHGASYGTYQATNYNQPKKKTSKEIVYQPKTNIQLGLYYFDTLLAHFNENYILAFAAYNAGLGNVERWIEKGTITKEGKGVENIPFPETNMYVRKIIRNYKIYQELYK